MLVSADREEQVPSYLGFDSSTQGLTAMLLAVDGGQRGIVWQRTLNFDADFPHYGTRHGVLRDADPRVARSSPRLWAEALDRMFEILAAERPPELATLAAVAGSAQQHGSVYLTAEAGARLSALDPRTALADQLDDVFSRPTSPIWMDSSTTRECDEITASVGGANALAQLTGSRAFERFTGPQIRRFFHEDPEDYARTGTIHLVSSFLASLLSGTRAGIDPGDGSGMNLMDLRRQAWAPAALDATAPGLASKLPEVVAPWTVVGGLSAYWRRRYDLPAARVIAWTGDNPSSLIGTGLVREGRVAISLGTSDTIFGAMDEPRVDDSGTGHVFGAPTGRYMGMTVFKNGSLARERIRDAYGLDWAGFTHALRDSPPGNGGALMLPWFEPEITPTVLTPGVHRRGLDPADAAANVRGVVEAQMLAMYRHSRWMGVAIDTIHATGGASANPEILQVMADVFGADVRSFAVGNSACLGAAMRAWHADARASRTPVEWEEIVERVIPAEGRIVRPVREHTTLYHDLSRAYEDFERDMRSVT
jgi:xylulokinase